MDYDVDVYFTNYDNYESDIVFNYSCGGLGDFLKFYKECFMVCVRYRVRIHMLLSDHFVHNFVKLLNSNTYITHEELRKNKVNNLTMDNIDKMLMGEYYMVSPIFFIQHI